MAPVIDLVPVGRAIGDGGTVFAAQKGENMRASGTASGVSGLLALSLSAFGVFGLWAGCHAVLLADLSRTLGISTGPLGIALFVGAAASMAAMAGLGWTADRLGHKAFLVAVTCLLGFEIAGIALAWNFWSLVAVLVLLSPAGGLYDVGINSAAVDLERFSGRRFMSFLHAAYSGGAVVGAIAAGALLSTGVGYRLVYLSLLFPLAILTAAFATARFPRTGGGSTGPSAGTLPEPGGNIESVAAAGDGAGRWDLYRSAPVLLVAAVGALGLLSEGEMQYWGGIFLRESLGFGALVGGSGVAAFFGAMALGRLGTGWMVRRLGNRRTLVAAGPLMASGMALALATTSPAIVVGGFLLVGLAVAGVVPVAYSVAGDLEPERVGAAVSVVTTFAYGGGLLATPTIGGLAELIGLRAALGTIALAGLAIFLLSLRLGEGRGESIRS